MASILKSLRLVSDPSRLRLLLLLEREELSVAELQEILAMGQSRISTQLAQLKASLARHFGKAIEAAVRVEPALIGGARITVGDRVIDGSVQGKLTTMANELSA